MNSMPFNLRFQTKDILNPWSMLFNHVKVSFYGFAILFKIFSAHCVPKLIEMHFIHELQYPHCSSYPRRLCVFLFKRAAAILTLSVPGGGLFLAPTRENLLAFFCERENCFQMLLSFLVEDFNTSQWSQIFYSLLEILRNSSMKMSGPPHF